MFASHTVVAPAPSAKSSGRAFAYGLRGLSKSERADQAVNGVPTLGPPFTDGQLAALYHVTRAALKAARERAKPSFTSTAEAEIKEFIQEHGVAEVWDGLVAILDEAD